MTPKFFCEADTLERGPACPCEEQCNACRLAVAVANTDPSPVLWPEEQVDA